MAMTDGPRGLGRGLTNYGDADFALYLRRSFATSMGYSKAMLARPVIGIAQSASGFNNCHRHFPELIEARSEERRVGKECRSRWWPEQLKKKEEEDVERSVEQKKRESQQVRGSV